jgi:ribosome-associated translation inhibitor RaiA
MREGRKKRTYFGELLLAKTCRTILWRHLMEENDNLQDSSDFDFDFEFHNMVGELGEVERALRTEAMDRLMKLAEGHTDMVGAAIAIEREDKQAQTGYLIRARVVAYTRPDTVTGIEKDENAMGALKGALSKVERQVREKRDKLRTTRRQPNEPGQEEIS